MTPSFPTRRSSELRIAVQRNLLRLAPRWFEENRPSEIASRLTADTAVVEIVVGTTLSVALRNLLVGVGGVIYLRSEEHTSELQSLMRISYAVFCLKNKRNITHHTLSDTSSY